MRSRFGRTEVLERIQCSLLLQPGWRDYFYTPQAASDLLPIVYNELRKLAAARMSAEAAGHTLDATALVHEDL